MQTHEKQNRKSNDQSLPDSMGATDSKWDSQTNGTHYGQQGIRRILKRNKKELHNPIRSAKQPQTKSS
jgi:hypothetical protein